MLKDGEHLKDNQTKEISIRNIKLSEGKSRNRCIHSGIDVRAMSVKVVYVGRANIPHKRALKNRLVTRSHVISQEEETRSSPEVEKAVIW